MEKEKREQLKSLGVDVDSTLERFMGNEELYLKFVRKTGEDPTVGELMEALERGDYDAVYRSAHTLKGVAANLGFSYLQSAAEKAVCLMREDPADWNRMTNACEEVEEQMRQVLLVTNIL